MNQLRFQQWQWPDDKSTLLSICGIAGVCTIGVGATIYFIKKYRSTNIKTKSLLPFPPGPRCYPLVGNLTHSIMDHEGIQQIRKDYGDIIYYHVFGKPILILSGFKYIEDALNRANGGDAFNGRMKNTLGDALTHRKGIVASEGELWRTHRRFILHHLRDLGLGRSAVEECIAEQADWVCGAISEEAKTRASSTPAAQAFDPRLTLNRAVNNVISTLLFGRLSSGDSEFEDLVMQMARTTQMSGDFIKKYKKLFRIFLFPLQLILFFRVMFFFVRFTSYISRKVKQQKLEFKEGKLLHDDSLMGAYIAEAQRLDASEGPGQHLFDDFQMLRVALELFPAGTETVVSTLRWALILMALHPEVQTRVQQEIGAAIGARAPTYADRARMRYTEATLFEIQRVASLAPILVRRVTDDCTVSGYRVPKETIAVINLRAVHQDPSFWPSPDSFAVENFLEPPSGAGHSGDSASGEVPLGDSVGRLVRTERLVSFAVGKRDCIGKSLALPELFIFFVRMMQHFTVQKPAPGPEAANAKKVNDIEGVETDNPFLRIPSTYPIIFIPRSTMH